MLPIYFKLFNFILIALLFFGSFELPLFFKIGVITPTDQLTGITPLSKNKVKQFKIYWKHKLHSIFLNIHW
jgi:hypothetical protein